MARGMVRWTPDKVQAAKDPYRAFSEYMQQTLGTPWPAPKDLGVLKNRMDAFFERYPHCDWHTPCRVVQFMTARKMRVSHIWMVDEYVRKAWAAGVLPELDPSQVSDPRADTLIDSALAEESDPVWRKRLLLAQSSLSKMEVWNQWNRCQPVR